MTRTCSTLALSGALLLFIVSPLAAQSSDAEGGVQTFAPAANPDDGVFAPTRVRVGLKDGLPVVQWQDHPNASGYAVFRHDAPIDAAVFDAAVELGRVGQGVMSLQDRPERDGRYFYAVLALDSSGQPVTVFEPLRNATIAGLPVAGPGPGTEASAPAAPTPAAVVAAPLASAPATGLPAAARAPVQTIQARAQDDAIRVSYTGASPGARLILYRSASPINDLAALLAASTVATFEDKGASILDYPVPGIGYYYAIVDEDSLRTGRIALVRGSNATTSPAEIPAGRYRVGLPSVPPASRSIPLPFLYLSRSVSPDGRPIGSGLDLPARKALSPAGEKAVVEILGYATPIERTAPALTVLEEDRALAGSGDEYTLRLIVSERLSKGEWKEASDEFARYLSLRRSPALEARARFYRGQALAMSGRLREAFFEFLLAEPYSGAAGIPWTDWILEELRRGKR